MQTSTNLSDDTEHVVFYLTNESYPLPPPGTLVNIDRFLFSWYQFTPKGPNYTLAQAWRESDGRIIAKNLAVYFDSQLFNHGTSYIHVLHPEHGHLVGKRST